MSIGPNYGHAEHLSAHAQLYDIYCPGMIRIKPTSIQSDEKIPHDTILPHGGALISCTLLLLSRPRPDDLHDLYDLFQRQFIIYIFQGR